MRHLVCWIVFSGALFAASNEIVPLDDFVSEWKLSKEFTIAVAEKMPEEAYSFRPTEGEMTFAQQMIHLANASIFRFAQLTGDKPPIAKLPENPTKSEVLKRLNESFDYVLEKLPKITPEQMDKSFDVRWEGRPVATGRQMMVNMFVHVAHHRAQCEVYLRIKGIVPPTYRF